MLAFGETKKLPANTFTRDGYTFVNWNNTADGSDPEMAVADQYEITFNNDEQENNAVFTLYAQWEKDEEDPTDPEQPTNPDKPTDPENPTTPEKPTV